MPTRIHADNGSRVSSSSPLDSSSALQLNGETQAETPVLKATSNRASMSNTTPYVLKAMVKLNPRRSKKTKFKQLLAFLSRPRRSFERHIARPLKRRLHQLPWATQQTFQVALTMSAVLYYTISVPFRLGFLYDPTRTSTSWTNALTILTGFDLICDIISVRAFVVFYHTWHDEFSQLSESVSFEVGKKMAKKTRGPSKLMQQAEWTLTTIAPTASAASQLTPEYHRRQSFYWILELIAILPIDLIVLGTQQYNLLHMLRLTKLCRVWRLSDCITRFNRIYSERRWMQQLSLTGISTLIRHIAVAVLLCHWFACGFMMIAHYECGLALDLCTDVIETNWVVKDRLRGASTVRKYARALYWSSRTQVMLGFDDLTPISNTETFYVLMVQVVNVLVTSAVLATFLFIFRYRNSRQAAFNAHMDNAREYMKSQGMPSDVRRKVMSYFQYAWVTHHSLDGEEVLQALPKHLQSKVIYTLKASRIKQICFLMKESIEFVNILALSLVHRVYIPGDAIIEPKMNAKMFFVVRGTVVLTGLDGSHAKECNTGDFFADCCLLTPEKYEERAMAKTYCELLVLDKSAFDEAIGQLYRGREQETLDRMIQTYERYATQLRKTKKLLGVRDAHERRDSIPSHIDSPMMDLNALKSVSGEWRMPGSEFRVHWDFLRLFAILYITFEVPYYLVFISNHDVQWHFNVRIDFGLRYIISMLVEAYFMINLIFHARFFAYLDPVAMLNVVDPSLIFAAYKQNGFVLDLIATIPVALMMETINGNVEDYSWMFRLLRLLRLRELRILMQNLFDYFNLSSKIQLIVSLFMGVTIMVHIIACLWFQMAWMEGIDGNQMIRPELVGIGRQECLRMATLYHNCTWAVYDCYGQVGSQFPVGDAHSHYVTSFGYIRAVYWAIVALTGVGYGDIVAYSTVESFFAAMWIFIGGMINFGIVGAMSSTIGTLMATQHQHVDKLNAVNSVMEHLAISKPLRSEIRRFYHHQFQTRKKGYESQLLGHLPDQLCYQISSLLHSASTKRLHLFDSASPEFLEEITGKFRNRTYQNGETLYIEGDICKEFLVLTHGKVNLFSQARKVPIGALHEGDCYGVSAFILKHPHPASLTAASPIQASVMTREHFDGILRKFADDMRDIREEAADQWYEEMKRLRSVIWNLEHKPKLKPHTIWTQSLFYHRDATMISQADRTTSGTLSMKTRHGPRDEEEMRTQILSVWHELMTMWNIYNGFSIIFRIAFITYLELTSTQFHLLVVVDFVSDLFFLVDIYFRLFYHEIEDIDMENLWTRAEWNLSYWKSRRFYRDLFASLPLYYINANAPVITSCVRLPRLLRCVDLWGYIDEVIIQIQQVFASKNVSSYLLPLKLLFFLLLGTHYAGCIFFTLSEAECHVNPINCWMTHDVVLHESHHSVFMLYIRSFYWALTTLTFVGSREIAPRGVLATLWSACTCLGCTFFMSYIIGELSELILDMNKEEKEFKSRLDRFEHFAKVNELSSTIRGRVGLFFKVEYEHTQGKDLHATTEDLSANLRLKLMHEIFGTALTSIPIARFLTLAQVNNLALRLKSEIFIPGDEIVTENTSASRLCILRRGIAAVFWSDAETNVAILLEGCLFGEVGFFLPRQRRIATVKATVSCEILHISKYAWKELWGENGDTTDAHAHKYAQRSILEWVNGRLKSYQSSALHLAQRTHSNLIERRIKENLESMLASSRKNKRGMMPTFHTGQTFLSPSAILLEKKAKYLLDKTEKIMNQHGDSYRGISHGHIRIGAAPSNRTAQGTVKPASNECYVNVNPLSKKLKEFMTDGMLRNLENESWRRFRYLGTLHYMVGDMMTELLPHSLLDQLNNVSGRNHVTHRLDNRRFSVFTTQKQQQPVKTQGKHKDPIKSQKSVRVLVKTASMPSEPANVIQPSTQSMERLQRMKRCHSLPQFNKQYFTQTKLNEEQAIHKKGHVTTELMGTKGITFDILQRSQRPKYATLYRFYSKYVQWKNQVNDSGSASTSDVPVLRRVNSHHLTESVQSKGFQDLITRIRKMWMGIMLLIALYSALMVPFKVAYVYDLEKSEIAALYAWSSFEYFMDAFWAIDFVIRVYRSSHFKRHSTHTTNRNAMLGRILHFLPRGGTFDGFYIDILGIIPTEIFTTLVTANVSSHSDSPLSSHTVWQYTCYLRLNKLLYTRRATELSESLFQYIVYDLKLPITENVLYFARAVAEYLMMGHWMACWWFAISQSAYDQYETSWLSYPGMLMFVNTSSSHLHRMLSTTSHSVVHDLEHVSLVRKYLRSMHFAISSITTLFYGDIVSMNVVELLFEMFCIIWAIYIFGTLVGAHGEVLEENSRHNVVFEQFLHELQHYLTQNDIPKALKKQIKEYYASIWRRRHGDDEFEAIKDVSRSLHQDTVYATLHQFANNVPIFQSLDGHFLRALLVKLQYVVCCENEEIIMRGDVDRSMYFISNGRILMKLDKAEIMKEQGTYFGELALLYGIPRAETCIALTISELYRLDDEAYEELLLHFPEFRVRNKREWAIAQTATNAALHKLKVNLDNLDNLPTDNPIPLDESTKLAIVDEAVPQCYIFIATMTLLAKLGNIDPLQAKYIVERGKEGARKYLTKLTFGSSYVTAEMKSKVNVESQRGFPLDGEQSSRDVRGAHEGTTLVEEDLENES